MKNIKELNLKNLVYCSVSNDKQVYEVMALDWMNQTVMLNGVRMGEVYSILKIKPIPLNEQWLIKFGFEKVKGVHEPSVVYDFTNSRCYINMADQRIEFRGNGSLDFSNVEYVHEFQNLYHAGTGNDLTTNP